MSPNLNYNQQNYQPPEQQLQPMMEDKQQGERPPIADINATLETIESRFIHPTLSDYYKNLTPFITLSIFVAALIVILNIAIFCTTASRIRHSVHKYYRLPTIILCSLYPIICCAALTTILFPYSQLVCHTVMHLSFTVGAVVFHQLCFRYMDPEIKSQKEIDCTAVSINTPPCCCCCLFLPTVVPSNDKFSILRYMIWQMPFVQGCIMLVLNVIYYSEKDLYASVSNYFIPFIVCSILLGLWGLNITVRMVHNIHSEYNLMKKMLCLQLILMLCKLQYVLLDNLLDNLVLGGEYPINHIIYKQTIINILILCEMILVSMLAQNAYKVPN